MKEITQNHAIDGLYTKDGFLKEKHFTEEIIAKIKVLNLGCGNSIFCEDMYDEGYKNIYNMDISSVCIEQMKKRN